MIVDYAAARAALALNDGSVPNFPKVNVTLKETKDGLAEMTIDGSAHATEEDVARALGLPVDVIKIKRTTPTTVGHVVCEPHREPSPGAVASRGRIKRTDPRPQQPPPDVVSANAPVKGTRARTAGRRK